jgi:hypothetical protein
MRKIPQWSLGRTTPKNNGLLWTCHFVVVVIVFAMIQFALVTTDKI